MPLLRILAAVCLICLGRLANANGGGTYIGNGGTSIVCFSESLKDALADGVLTESGRLSITQAMPAEEFIAAKSSPPGSLYESLQNHTYEENVNFLHSRFEETNLLYNLMMSAFSHHWFISKGAMVSGGLKSSQDAIELVTPPVNCAQLQTVTSTSLLFLVQADIWNHLNPRSQAILQLHEDLYAAARAKGIDNSTNVTLLISQMLMSKDVVFDLPFLLKSYGLN